MNGDSRQAVLVEILGETVGAVAVSRLPASQDVTFRSASIVHVATANGVSRGSRASPQSSIESCTVTPYKKFQAPAERLLDEP